MKFIINESQYKRLLYEQKVYTSQTEYDKAMELYNDVVSMVKAANRFHDFAENFYNDDRISFSEVMKNYRSNDKIISDLLSKKYKKEDFFDLIEKSGFINNVKSDDVTQRFMWDYCYSKNKRIDKDKRLMKRGIGSHSKIDCPITNKHIKFDTLRFLTPPIKPILNLPSTPTIEPPKKIEPVKTTFSATFGSDNKQETKYFNNFDEWKKFDDSVRGKFGYISSNYNKSKTEASTSLKGTPSEWAL